MIWRARDSLFTCLSIASIGVLWEIVVRVGRIEPYVLPSFTTTLLSLWKNRADLVANAIYTGMEATFGFTLGTGFALISGALAGEFELVKKALEPILVFSQVVPKVALAPVFIIWFGFGAESKIAIAALICFFPAYIACARSIGSTSEDLVIQGLLVGQSRASLLVSLKLPMAATAVMSGVRASSLLAVVGVVVGEFTGSDRGLGAVILEASGRFDTPLVLAAVISVSIVGAVMYLLVALFEVWIFQKYGHRPRTSATPTNV